MNKNLIPTLHNKEFNIIPSITTKIPSSWSSSRHNRSPNNTTNIPWQRCLKTHFVAGLRTTWKLSLFRIIRVWTHHNTTTGCGLNITILHKLFAPDCVLAAPQRHLIVTIGTSQRRKKHAKLLIAHSRQMTYSDMVRNEKCIL